MVVKDSCGVRYYYLTRLHQVFDKKPQMRVLTRKIFCLSFVFLLGRHLDRSGEIFFMEV